MLAERGTVAGYDLATAITYVWLGQGLLAVVLLWGDTEFSDRVRSGDIVVDLGRPWDLQTALLATDLGRAGARGAACGCCRRSRRCAVLPVPLAASGR